MVGLSLLFMKPLPEFPFPSIAGYHCACLQRSHPASSCQKDLPLLSTILVAWSCSSILNVIRTQHVRNIYEMGGLFYFVKVGPCSLVLQYCPSGGFNVDSNDINKEVHLCVWPIFLWPHHPGPNTNVRRMGYTIKNMVDVICTNGERIHISPM